MSDELKKAETKTITAHEFFFEMPLYAIVKKGDLEEDYDENDIDGYSVHNQIETTYSVNRKSLGNSSPYITGAAVYELQCKRKGEKLYFFTFENTDMICKIGQAPSLADMQYAELGKKYDKLLDKQDLAQLKKAIGLAAHGAGAGAFVYLRRVFEKLILETYEKHAANLSTTQDVFTTKHMEDKIQTLKPYLPSQLVEMRSIYSILSKGVHELSEEQCLLYFPALKLSIILILDQRLEEEINRKHDVQVKEQLAQISKEINKAKV